jgi:transposase-like protein
MSNDDLLSRRPRTRLDLSDADMARLRDLYYDRDVPMTKIAQSFGLSTSTLYHWIAEMDWPRRSATFPIRTHRPLQLPEGQNALADALPGEAPAAPHTSQPLDPHKLALDVAVAARQELAQMGDVSGPMSLQERKRRADIIASLSRSIQRIDKSFELKAERKQLKRLIKEQRERISGLQNAGLIDVQRAKFAVLKAQFAAVSAGQDQSAPQKARR